MGPQGIQGERGPVGKTYVDLNCLNESYYDGIYADMSYKTKLFNIKKYNYTL
jgi:hypothetical protein